MKDDKRVIWPAAIPRGVRKKVDTGRGSFCWVRAIDDSNLLHDGQVALKGHVLIVVMSGKVLIEVFGQPLTVECGGALMLGECEFSITEVAQPPVYRAEVHYFFFDQRVIGNEIGGNPAMESFAWHNSAPDTYVRPVREFTGPLLSYANAGQIPYPYGLSKVLRILVSRFVPASFFSIVRRTFYRPRMELCVFMEHHVLRCRGIEDIAKRYPAGAEMFTKRFRALLREDPAQWLQRRRMQLATVWIAYTSAEPADVAAALGLASKDEYQTPAGAEIRERVEKFQRLGSHEELSPAAVKEMARPFWVPPPPLEVQPPPPPCTLLCPEDLEAAKKFTPWNPAPELPAECVQEFWAMQSTGMGSLFHLPDWLSDLDAKIAA